MYAVFKTGGKQYRASKGDRLRVEKVEAKEGDNIEFDKILLVGEGTDITVGTPLLEGAKISAKVISQGRDKKIKVVKFKRRTNYRRTKGHRQFFTEIEVLSISGDKKTSPKAADSVKKKATTKKATTKKATTKKAATKKATTKKKQAKKKSKT